jgi:hypothetical protein
MDQAEVWREIADQMYKHLVQEWCWHCGHALERHFTASEILDKYREAVDGSPK